MASCCGIGTKVTGASARSAGKLARRGHKRSRLGVVLAVVALLAQIAGAGVHVRAPIAPANVVDKLFVDFGAHALCLAPDSTAPGPQAPADEAPKADYDFAGCCVWHGVAGAVLTPAALVQAVVFAESRVTFTAPPADIPIRLSGTVRARAPPVGAQRPRH
jgi:hypothetical protein